ncbi:MAG: DUF2157 domain-containing protein [Gemmatimonadota bacterium]
MPSAHRQVEAALRRWQERGLLPPEAVERLRTDAVAHAARERRRAAQLLIAATGAVVLLIATATFFSWVWPALGHAGRTLIVAGVGAALVAGGLAAERAANWRVPARVAEVAGLIVLVVAGVYSTNAWANGSAPAVLVGVLALLVPVVGVPLTARRHPVLPVALVVLGHLFVFLFLYRALDLDGNTSIWILDGVLLAAGAVLAARLAAGRAAEWELHAVALSLYVAAALLLATIVGPLDLGEDIAPWPLDVWWVASTAAILWAVHRAPDRLRRDWYTNGLVLAMILGVVLAFWTTLEALDAPPEVAALTVAVLGGAGMVYALRNEARALLVTSAGALVVAAWYYGAERGRALGGVAALFVTAALLFWVAGRLGAMRQGEQT